MALRIGWGLVGWRALGRVGHDVLALAAESALEGLDDPEVLALAAAEGRILVTRNSRDFAPILRQWVEGGRHHAGCILIGSYDHSRFAEIAGGVRRLLEERPDPSGWGGIVVAL
jgi:hypothetical protein